MPIALSPKILPPVILVTPFCGKYIPNSLLIEPTVPPLILITVPSQPLPFPVIPKPVPSIVPSSTSSVAPLRKITIP